MTAADRSENCSILDPDIPLCPVAPVRAATASAMVQVQFQADAPGRQQSQLDQVSIVSEPLVIRKADNQKMPPAHEPLASIDTLAVAKPGISNLDYRSLDRPGVCHIGRLVLPFPPRYCE